METKLDFFTCEMRSFYRLQDLNYISSTRNDIQCRYRKTVLPRLDREETVSSDNLCVFLGLGQTNATYALMM
jgi:hypothetical protein